MQQNLGSSYSGGIIYLLYELSIVQGYKLTNYMIPFLEGFRNAVEVFLPTGSFSGTAHTHPCIKCNYKYKFRANLYSYFLSAFALIAVLEDVKVCREWLLF